MTQKTLILTVGLPRAGRRFIGIDLSEEYCQMARDRIARYYQRDARARRVKAAEPSLFEEDENV